VLITGQGDLKLCDFGLSRTFNGIGNYSTRVITLWYRPPELLLGTRHYDESVDIWSAGCIAGELLAGYPLFSESTEIKVFHKIRERCSATSEDAWPESLRALPQWKRYLVPKEPERTSGNGGRSGSQTPVPNSDVFGDALAKHGPAAVDLLRVTLRLDPTQRHSADSVLEHSFFSQEPLACQPREIKINPHVSCHELDVKKHREQLREKEAQRLQGKRPPVHQGGGGNSPKRSRVP